MRRAHDRLPSIEAYYGDRIPAAEIAEIVATLSRRPLILVAATLTLLGLGACAGPAACSDTTPVLDQVLGALQPV